MKNGIRRHTALLQVTKGEKKKGVGDPIKMDTGRLHGLKDACNGVV